MPALRVLQLIGDFTRSGAELQALTLARWLEGPDCHYTLCAREDGSLRAEVRGADTLVLPKGRTLDSAYFRALLSVIREKQIQLVHSHLFGNDLYGFLASWLTGVPLILTVHGWDSLESCRRRLAYRLIVRRATRVIAVSEILKAEFWRRIGVRDDKLIVIHNGIDVERYACQADRNALRRRLGLPLTGPLIGMVGNIKPVKGIDILLESVPLVLARYPNARFLIVGGMYNSFEAYRASLERLIDRLDIRDRLIFAGVTDAVPEILAALDVYVVPSRSEGLSLALLEAMASGVPVVATAVGGTPGVVQHEVTGVLVPPESPADLASGLCRVLDDPFSSRVLGAAARKRVAEQYHSREMASRYLALYHEVLRATGRAVGCAW